MFKAESEWRRFVFANALFLPNEHVEDQAHVIVTHDKTPNLTSNVFIYPSSTSVDDLSLPILPPPTQHHRLA